jgi:hypothetical protein
MRTKFKTILNSGVSALCLLFAGMGAGQLQAQVSYSFTPCGATGENGPTQGMANSTYAGTNLQGNVTVTGGGYQSWVVPVTGDYGIRAVGASGGSTSMNCSNNGGLGADIYGEFHLTAGDVILILVGQEGLVRVSGSNSDGGGGGGSFVATSSSVALVVGGGGGGATNNIGSCGGAVLDGVNASLTTAGTVGGNGLGTAGTNGNGGTGTGGGGGGGFLTNGTGSSVTYAGKSFMNGGVGGVYSGIGGFGGGGSGFSTGGNGGGGGGYSGGGTNSSSSPYTGGGGGGSYNAGINQNNVQAASRGDGLVVITFLCPVNVSATKNPICQGESLTLTTDAVSNILWSNGSTNPSIQVSPSTTTSYSVVGQAAGGCTVQIVTQVTVNPLPAVSAIVNPSVLCVGKTATLSGVGALSYTWTANNTVAPSSTVNPVVTSSYNYIGENQFGCTTTTVVNVVVNTNSLTVTAPAAICAGTTLEMLVSGAESYTWSTGSYFNTTIVSPVANTTYTVGGTDQHNCDLSEVISLQVNPAPNVTAVSDQNSVCRGESVTLTAAGADTYLWNTGASSNQLNVTLDVDIVYNYTVTGTGSNGCTTSTIVTVTANRCTGIEKVTSGNLISRVYPSPANEAVTIELSNGAVSNIEIVDLSGRVVISLPAVTDRVQADISALSAGVYYVKVKSGTDTDIMKMVKH